MKIRIFMALALLIPYGTLAAETPALQYATLIADSISYTPFYAADADDNGNLYAAIMDFNFELPEEERSKLRVFQINPEGTQVDTLVTLSGYSILWDMACRGTDLYIRAFNDTDRIIKCGTDGSIIYATDPGLLLNSQDPCFYDDAGNMYLAINISADETLPPGNITPDALVSAPLGGKDIVIQKYDPEGTLVYGSYLGGTVDDQVDGVGIGEDGTWYLYMSELSPNFPYPVSGDAETALSTVVTISPDRTSIQGRYATTYAGIFNQAIYGKDAVYNDSSSIIYKVSYDGELQWEMSVRGGMPLPEDDNQPSSTMLSSFTVDEEGRIYTVKSVDADDPFATTSDALSTTVPGSGSDLGIWQISDDAELLYGTYWGGSYAENSVANAITAKNGTLYIVGFSLSPDLPLTPGAYIDSRPEGAIMWGLYALAIEFDPDQTHVSDGADAMIPTPIAIDPPHPNPFNPETTISFSLADAGDVRLAIYDVSGQKVRELAAGYFTAGHHSLVWNGRDESGSPVGSGVYFCKIISGQRAAVRKVTLLR